METNNGNKDNVLRDIFSAYPLIEPSAGFTDSIMAQIEAENPIETQPVLKANSKNIWYLLISISGLGAIISLYSQLPVSQWLRSLTGGWEIEFGAIIYLHEVANKMLNKIQSFESNQIFIMVGIALLGLYVFDRFLKNKIQNSMNSFLIF